MVSGWKKDVALISEKDESGDRAAKPELVDVGRIPPKTDSKENTKPCCFSPS